MDKSTEVRRGRTVVGYIQLELLVDDHVQLWHREEKSRIIGLANFCVAKCWYFGCHSVVHLLIKSCAILTAY